MRDAQPPEDGPARSRVPHSLVSALRSVPTLASLDEPMLLTIVGDSANLFWRSGSVVFEKGSPADGLYIVLSGAVRVLDDDGAEVNVLEPGEFFGELSLLFGTPHANRVEIVEDAELMVVPKESFDALAAASPELRESIRATAERRLGAGGTRPA